MEIFISSISHALFLQDYIPKSTAEVLFFFHFSLLHLFLWIFSSFPYSWVGTGQEPPLMSIQKPVSHNDEELNYFLVFEKF